jgi:putative endonuclease
MGNCIEGSNPFLSAMFFCYILKSLKDGSFYVGQCNDLDCRMSKHFDGFSKYTSSKRPLRLVYFETFDSREKALKREKEIKGKKSKKYIEFLILNWSPNG